MVTSKDVARLAGVSQATVSRVIRGSQRVAPGTRDKVMTVLEETGYVPNASATAMRTRRIGTVGVVVERITNPFYPELLEQLGAELEARDLRLILWNASIGAGARAAVDAIEGRLVDGLIFTTATGTCPSLNAALRRRAPVVLVNRVVDEVPCDQVDSDNRAASAAIAEYFAAHGHERVGLVPGRLIASTGRDRSHGFAERAAELGMELMGGGEPMGDGQFTHEAGRRAIEMMFAPGRTPPTAVFGVNDLSAFGAIDAARSMGLSVPDDLWVVGFDGIAMTAWSAYDVTTAAQSIEKIVTAAVDLLLARIDDPGGAATHQRFSTELIVRGSTAHAPLPKRAFGNTMDPARIEGAPAWTP